MSDAAHASKRALLDASLAVIREKGYGATRVEDVCARAGLTKGSFFHHFAGKEQLAVEAAAHFGSMADGLFATAPFTQLPDPRERLLAYVDFRIALLQGRLPEFTCLLGTMVQETYDTHPAIRAACEKELASHVAMLARDIEAARAAYAPAAPWSAESLASHMQAVIQGAFVLAKAAQGPAVAVDCLRHLRHYLGLLLARSDRKEPSPWPEPSASHPSSGTTPRRRTPRASTARSSRTRAS